MRRRHAAIIAGFFLVLGGVTWCSVQSDSGPAGQPARAARSQPEVSVSPADGRPAFERDAIMPATPMPEDIRHQTQASPVTVASPEAQEANDVLADQLDRAALTFVSDMPDVEAFGDVLLALANATQLIPGTARRERDLLEMRLRVRDSALAIRALLQADTVTLRLEARGPKLPSSLFVSRAIQCVLVATGETLGQVFVSVGFQPDISGTARIEPVALCNGHSFTLLPGAARVLRHEGTLTTGRWSPNLESRGKPWPACNLLAYRRWLDLVRELVADDAGRAATELENAPRGWAFVGGVYLPPPHVVTTEGLSILINGRYVVREQPEVRLQPPTRHPQPATPHEAMEEIRALQIEQQARGATVQEVTREALAFLKHQSFVASAEQGTATEILVRWAGVPNDEHIWFTPFSTAAHEERLKSARDRAESYEKSLRAGALLVSDGGGSVSFGDGREQIEALTSVLSSAKTRAQKLEEVTRLLLGFSLAAEHIVDHWGQ
ncbi:MAG: hypothetical protein U1E76_16750 [Planctomycetota bacterium]